MKILFIAVFSDSSTNNAQSRGFQNAGHEVIEYNYREIAKEHGNLWRDGHLVSVCLEEKPDLVLFSKCDEISEAVIIECNRVCKTALWYMDPMENWSISLQLKASFCDYVFCALEKPYEELKKYNDDTYLIPEGFDHTIDYPREESEIFDVSFIGSLKWDREKYFKTRNFTLIHDAYGKEHARMVAKSKINLNFVVNNEGISDRVYKILAAKGFLLTQPWVNMDKYFNVGQDFDIFTNYKEYEQKINYYLDNSKQRVAIAEQGFITVQKYTRDAWAKQLLRRIK